MYVCSARVVNIQLDESNLTGEETEGALDELGGYKSSTCSSALR